MTGEVRETYHAALQHDLADLDGEETLVGVVRRPTPWFTQVDENVPALGPPGDLLSETKQATENLKARGFCDEEAHNAAWEETGFEVRYREHLEASEAARTALDDLAERVRAGESVALVCFEGDDKRCHRRTLVDVLEARVAGSGDGPDGTAEGHGGTADGNG